MLTLSAIGVAVDGEGGDARSRMRRLFALGVERGDLVRIDLAVRNWARRDRLVAKRLRRVDNRRMDYLRTLFGAFCADEGDVEARSMIVMALFTGSHFVAADHGGRSRAAVLDLALRHLLST